MTYGLWLSAGGLQVNQYRQEILANNMANVDTVGFKKDLAVVHERPVESRRSPEGIRYRHDPLDRLSGGMWVRPTYHDFQQGELTATGNPLDTAIDGNGFFTIRDGDELRYTRDGRFTINPAGELVMVAGNGRQKVADSGGRPISVDPTAGKVRIRSDGTIMQNNASVGKLGVVEFADRQNLRKVGKNLFTNTEGRPAAATDSTVRGGFVENSTQDPMKGLVELIEVTRAHELNARMISLQDQTIGQAVNTVGRIR